MKQTAVPRPPTPYPVVGGGPFAIEKDTTAVYSKPWILPPKPWTVKQTAGSLEEAEKARLAALLNKVILYHRKILLSGFAEVIYAQVRQLILHLSNNLG